jgi:protein-tyrosine phosphatase
VRQALRYDLVLGLDPELSRSAVVADLPEPVAAVNHLFVDTGYFWKVVAKLDGEPVAESRTGHFRTHPALPRWIRVPEITNVRDLGGWPVPGGQRVRQGLLYRSSEMNRHLELTAEGETVLLRELGIRTDLDLRAEDEGPTPALPEEWVRYVNAPFLPYERIAEEPVMASVARIFGVLADGDAYPVLMHCWAGADRAGTAAFLVLAALGVQLPDLEADYELSSLSVWGERSRHGPDFRRLLEAVGTFAGSPGEPVTRQVENYLQAAGVPAETLARLRAGLLEPAPSPLPETPW